jgi:Ca-activated chloride channel family protein
MSTRETTSETTNETRTNEREPRLGRSIAVGVALLAFTLVGGWAAGNSGARNPHPTPGGGGTFHASAASGKGNVHFRGQLDRTSVLENGDGLVGLELVLSADDAPADRRARMSTDLVVVLDRSGSMQGKPLADALASVRELVGRLGADDRFALVTYASDVHLRIPLEDANADNRRRWLATVNGIASGGGTNMAIGIDLAADTIALARQPGRVPRVIVLSDGHANQGDHSYEGLRARASRAVTGEYVLSTVGVGQGFDEVLMTALADAGTGNFYYVQNGSDLGDVFAREFDSARDTVASAVAVEIDLGPGVEIVEAAGYPVEREGRTARFRPGTLFAGQERHIWLQLRAPTNRVGDVPLAELRMIYRDAGAPQGFAPQVLRIDEPLQLACVQDERVFAASLEPEMVVRGIVEEKLAALKQSVASSVRSGNFDKAKRQIGAYQRRNRKDYDRLGLRQEETDSYRESRALIEDVEAAFNAPKPAAARNALSKTLSAEGQDGRRQGAKK